jgi:hypothetical protein
MQERRHCLTQHGLGFPLLLRRERMKGSRGRLQEGDDARRHRRRPTTASGFLPTLPSAPQSTSRHPGSNSRTCHQEEANTYISAGRRRPEPASPGQPQIVADPSSTFPAGRRATHSQATQAPLKTAWCQGHGPWIQIGPKDPDLALEFDRRWQATHAPATSCTTVLTPPLHRTTSTIARPAMATHHT